MVLHLRSSIEGFCCIRFSNNYPKRRWPSWSHAFQTIYCTPTASIRSHFEFHYPSSFLKESLPNSPLVYTPVVNQPILFVVASFAFLSFLQVSQPLVILGQTPSTASTPPAPLLLHPSMIFPTVLQDSQQFSHYQNVSTTQNVMFVWLAMRTIGRQSTQDYVQVNSCPCFNSHKTTFPVAHLIRLLSCCGKTVCLRILCEFHPSANV